MCGWPGRFFATNLQTRQFTRRKGTSRCTQAVLWCVSSAPPIHGQGLAAGRPARGTRFAQRRPCGMRLVEHGQRRVGLAAVFHAVVDLPGRRHGVFCHADHRAHEVGWSCLARVGAAELVLGWQPDVSFAASLETATCVPPCCRAGHALPCRHLPRAVNGNLGCAERRGSCSVREPRDEPCSRENASHQSHDALLWACRTTSAVMEKCAGALCSPAPVRVPCDPSPCLRRSGTTIAQSSTTHVAE